jgi:hypothetical protein
MAGTKYTKNVILNSFSKASKDFGGKTMFNFGAENKAGFTYEYICMDQPKWAIKDSRVNDTWELLCFIGGNPKNINDLGAEVSVTLGDLNEEHIINSATVVSIPPGMKYGPITMKKYTKPFVLLRICTSKEYEAKMALKGEEYTNRLKAMKEGRPSAPEGNRYWMNIGRGPFYIAAEPGWEGTSIWAHHNEYRNGTTLGYHCITSRYYVDKNHGHDFHELLCFLGGDPQNINDLGAEVSIKLGDELEEHVFNTAGIISMPPGLKHCPLEVRNVKKPVVFLEVSLTDTFGQAAEKKKK